jgi:xanthine dehydrogenase molybdopterin-binding subunit B
MGGQEHFYFETNAAYVKPVDNCREMEVISSCQNVAHAQHSLAHALGVKMHHINVRSKRIGGGFGGKEWGLT